LKAVNIVNVVHAVDVVPGNDSKTILRGAQTRRTALPHSIIRILFHRQGIRP
jgi:hypothetical protein